MTTETGRPRIRELREERGWTQQELAEQIARLAWVRHRERVGINADMVAKWERGAKGVSNRYRDLLCQLFEVDADYLRLGPAAVRRTSPTGPPSDEDSLVNALGGAASVLDQLGEAGAILQPRMFDVWKDELMHRRALLKLMGLTPVVGAFSPTESETTRSGRPTPGVVADLDQLADRYQALYHSTAPTALMTPVVAHLATASDLLRQGPAPAERIRLLENRARVATLAGRLAFFDLHNPMGARGYYNLAHEAAREAGDHLQAASALAHTAFIPASEHGFVAALDYLQAANRHVANRPHGPVASWLAAVESEMQTNAGNPKAALTAIDRAREALTNSRGAKELAWFDYYDSTRLEGFAGYATMRAGRFSEAGTSLGVALGNLPRTAVKQRAVFLVDRATVELHSGNLDEACRIVGDAADQLHQAGYATGADRIREFRAAVAPWKTSEAVRLLDEQLTTLA
ncbi:helix-turn-helix domain-containing protein [Cryptosporangium sp. NPDC051539]|uniref:helix-turn-helix domain-containing protein n=1 Tax=Cryptosporangium sp. NPDC051539 TaxID=3363962 RepID=UPI0037A6D000